MSSHQATSDGTAAAVADAIRSHDRFLLVTHENPDGDALGSILGTQRALEQLGKDTVMFLSGELDVPQEYGFMELDELNRTLPDDAYERVLRWIAPRLATYHGVSGNLRYWRIVVGPWLFGLVHVLYDRHASVVRALSTRL